MDMKILASITRAEIGFTEQLVDVRFDLTDLTKSLVNTLSPAYPKGRFQPKPERTSRLTPSQASVVVIVPSQLPINEFGDLQRTLAADLKDTLSEVTSRYREAWVNQLPVRRTNADLRALRLNEIAWNARRLGATVVMFPDEPYGWEIAPVDPATLRCETPSDEVTTAITRARVLGVYEHAYDRQDNLCLEDVVEIVVKLEHDVSAIRYSTTRADAQNIYRGIVILSAVVSGAKSEIPVVVGAISLERRDTL